MLKTSNPVNVEKRAVEALRDALGGAPELEVLDVQTSDDLAGNSIDLVFRIDFNGQQHVLVGEVKASGQPRHVQGALLQLKQYVDKQKGPVTPIFIAPYLSEEARSLCVDNEVGYLDLEGNARIVFPGFFMSRSVAGKPPAERRELRSLFKPKSASVLRTMLRNPAKHWRVADLANASLVSVGHVSNVRNSLLERGWAEVSDGGVFLSNPDGLLDAWREDYAPPAGERRVFYTTLHGSALEEALRRGAIAPAQDGFAILASFSAANWLAPYARTGTHHFYADEEGLDRLRQILDLSTATRGENVVVTVFADVALLNDSVEPTEGIHCTSPVQTYLDLYVSGERGREAAEHLRQERLQWQK
jgi:hypothetical protein